MLRVVTLVVLAFGTIALAAPARVAAATPGVAISAPTIRPSSHEPASGGNKSNIAGMVVGLVLLGGWLGTGTVMFYRARRRRTAAAPLPEGDTQNQLARRSVGNADTESVNPPDTSDSL